MTSELSADLRAWSRALHARGLRVLPQSTAVPVEVWLRDERTGQDDLLHLRARGTTVALTRYDAQDLAAVILRSECDCESHRTAGAAIRPTLVPGARPVARAVYDGRREAGWTGVEAGLLRLSGVATFFELRLPSVRRRATDASVTDPVLTDAALA